jgi:hypothetical protein
MNWQHHAATVTHDAHHFSSVVCFVQRTLCFWHLYEFITIIIIVILFIYLFMGARSGHSG